MNLLEKKRVEQSFDIFSRYSTTGVCHFYAGVTIDVCLEADGETIASGDIDAGDRFYRETNDTASLAHGFPCIGHQIGEDLVQVVSASVDNRALLREIDFQDHAFRHDSLNHGQALVAHCGEFQRLKFGLCLPEIGQHQTADFCRFAGRPHGFDQIFDGFIVLLKACYGCLHIHHHRHKLVIEVVGDSPSHSAQAFGLLKLPVLSLQFFLFRLRLLVLGNILQRSEKAQGVFSRPFST